MFLVVMLGGDGQIAQAVSIGLGRVADIVALQSPHEALRHTVALRATHRGLSGAAGNVPGKGPGLFGGIGAQPLHW